MASKRFQFKQFSVSQDRTTHKVGTDAVLLGSWVNIREDDKYILDIGTGSGVIALMLAQRTAAETHIWAVEIESADAQQAEANFARAPWANRISLHQGSIQEFHPGQQFDLIVSNPPYFVNSLTPPDEKRARARHAVKLTFADLLQDASRLLRSTGRIAVILPYSEGLAFISLASQFQLFPLRKTIFRSRPHKPAERLLIELSFEKATEAETTIILYSEDETWSPEYRKLTAEFYL